MVNVLKQAIKHKMLWDILITIVLKHISITWLIKEILLP